jgi:hypothetical protein
VCKGYQRIHKGGWALESCPNNYSKPPLPNFVGTKRDASSIFIPPRTCVCEREFAGNKTNEIIPKV